MDSNSLSFYRNPLRLHFQLCARSVPICTSVFVFFSVPLVFLFFFPRQVGIFNLIEKNQKIKKIRTASPYANAPPRIFFLPAPGSRPVILINRLVKNLFCLAVSKSGDTFRFCMIQRSTKINRYKLKSASGFLGKIGNRIFDNHDLVFS
jgi:hypothetical protein